MKYVLKFQVQFSVIFLFFALGFLGSGVIVETTWWATLRLFFAAMFGLIALRLAFQAGEKNGRGRIVSESKIPLAIYQVVKIVQFRDDAIAILCSNDGRKIVCGSDMDDGRFKNYIVQKIDGGEVLVPRFWFNGSKAPIPTD
ncbi:MAG: hypothetical protein AAB552_02960 [Patescibacteria group bacterium]